MGRLGNKSLFIFSSILCILLLAQCQQKAKSSSTATGPNCDNSALGTESADPFYSLQWHLSNSGGGSVSDLDMGTVWTTNKGAGIRVNVVDDGLEINHEDLHTNVIPNGGYNFWTGVSGFSSSTTDPSPQSSSPHGTSVAGLVAARDSNGLGVSGVAPRACLAGINLIANGGETSTQDAFAMTYADTTTAASNNSWGPSDNLGTLSESSSLWRSAISTALSEGYGGKGTSFVWAAGNGARVDDIGTTGGFETDNANYDGFANYYGVIAVCAINDLGARLFYSEKGANLWVCGFGETSTYWTDGRGLTTTDLTGNVGFNTYSASTATNTALASIGSTFFDYRHGTYTRIMDGTSGASPQVAGVIALMAKENSSLTSRDIRLILAETARKNDSSDSDWTTNHGSKLGSAGNYNINHKYGFGTVDAAAAVALAQSWTNVAAEEAVYDSGTITVNQAFANNDTNGATNALAISTSTITKIEYIEVTVTATGDIGDIDVRLTNTDGTVSVLAEPHSCWASSSSSSPLASCGQTYSGWRFGTGRHLNESANQTWTLRVSDRRNGTATSGGTFTSWRMKIHGRAL